MHIRSEIDFLLDCVIRNWRARTWFRKAWLFVRHPYLTFHIIMWDRADQKAREVESLAKSL